MADQVANVIPVMHRFGATGEFDKSPPVGSVWLVSQVHYEFNGGAGDTATGLVLINDRVVSRAGVSDVAPSTFDDFNNPIRVFPNDRLRLVCFTLSDPTTFITIEVAVVQVREERPSAP